MYIFYDLEAIQNFAIFSNYNFNAFSDFEKISILISVNTFYLLLIFFFIFLIYKVVQRIYNALF